jgi:alkylhydroperoxidase family enzyme
VLVLRACQPTTAAPRARALVRGGARGHNAGVSWVLDAASASRVAGETDFERVFSLRPNLFEDFRRFYALFFEARPLDPVLLELCRLRIAQLHGCEAELRVRYQPARDAGLDEEKIEALPRAATSPLYSEAERAAIAMAELFAIDPHAITDADAARVVGALGEPGTVALVEALALFDGFMRFRLTLGVEAPAVRVVAPAPGAGPLY